MPKRDIIVIGASAGGVEAVTRLIKQLPVDLPAALFVVLHISANSKSVLPNILQRAGSLTAAHATHGDPIKLHKIYVAPPDEHLLVQTGEVALSRGPRENGFRPAIDVLFRSAAQAYGQRVIGVVLSGMLDDGTAGLRSIKTKGGISIAQDPDEALFSSMPQSAIENGAVDHVLPVDEIANFLATKGGTSVAEEATMPNNSDQEGEARIVAQSKASLERGEQPDNPSPITCPDCGGVLWELRDGNLIRFRCHVGHAYSLDSLLEEQARDVERALWAAVRALEEKAALARRMAVQAHAQNRLTSESQFYQRAQEIEQNMQLLREMLVKQHVSKKIRPQRR
jgi:two-component system chemotaxis response regulator CheB